MKLILQSLAVVTVLVMSSPSVYAQSTDQLFDDIFGPTPDFVGAVERDLTGRSGQWTFSRFGTLGDGYRAPRSGRVRSNSMLDGGIFGPIPRIISINPFGGSPSIFGSSIFGPVPDLF